MATGQQTYKGTVGTLIILVVTGVALLVKIAGTLGLGGQNFEVLGPSVAGAERCTADLGVFSARHAGCDVVLFRKGPRGIKKRC